MKDKYVFTSTTIGAYELIDEPEARKARDNDLHLEVGFIPALKVDLIIGEPEEALLRLNKGDRLTYSRHLDDGRSKVEFVGEIERQRIHRLKGKPTILTVEAVSPFIRLQYVFLNQGSLSGCAGLRDILNRIRELGSIWGEFKVGEDVDDDVSIEYISDYPALAFLKHIFLQRNLVYTLIHGDAFIIQNRAAEHREAIANAPTFNADDFISIEFEK